MTKKEMKKIKKEIHREFKKSFQTFMDEHVRHLSFLERLKIAWMILWPGKGKKA